MKLDIETRTQETLQSLSFFEEAFVYSSTKNAGVFECNRIKKKTSSKHHIRGAICDCKAYGFRKYCSHLDIFEKKDRIKLDREGILPLFLLKILDQNLPAVYNEFCYKSMEEDWSKIAQFLTDSPAEKRIHGISLSVLPPSPIKMVHIWLSDKNWDCYIRLL